MIEFKNIDFSGMVKGCQIITDTYTVDRFLETVRGNEQFYREARARVNEIESDEEADEILERLEDGDIEFLEYIREGFEVSSFEDYGKYDDLDESLPEKLDRLEDESFLEKNGRGELFSVSPVIRAAIDIYKTENGEKIQHR